MPNYRDVAQLTLASLIDRSDEPKIAQEDENLESVAAKLAEGSTARETVVVVVDAAKRVEGIVSAADIAGAFSQGLTLESSAKELTSRKPPVVTVRDTSLLEQIPGIVGPYSTVVVTDEEGKPRAVLDREVLAERIKSRFVSSS